MDAWQVSGVVQGFKKGFLKIVNFHENRIIQIAQIWFPCDVEKGSYYNINTRNLLQVSTHGAAIVFLRATTVFQF